MVNRLEPYVGPRPFGREDEPLFFGRDREANELLSLIIAHPVVLIYAQSGAGKTSLLNAKVIPLLEGRRSEVFGSARVSGDLPQGIRSKDVKNIYVFNALLSLQRDLPDPAIFSGLTLRQFLELHPHTPSVDGIASRRVIIFDQFEELFTTAPERWQDRTDFFDNVGAALETDPYLRVVFAMREEYIANMDPFASTLPERLRTRFRLERLRKEAALEAVKKPLTGTRRAFAPGAAEKLVENLLRVPIKSATGTVDISGEYVEPVQLQVVCQNLWQSLPPDVETIDDQYIENYGDVDRALSLYYEDCLKKVVVDKNIREGELRRWFGNVLITSDGTRGTVYKDIKTTGGLPNDVVEILENMRLVRPELRGGAPWYELTHDRFIGPITKSNQDWFNQRSTGLSISGKLEAKAEEWAQTRSSKPRDGLLVELELDEAVQWVESPDAEDLGVSNVLRDFIQASKIEAERQRAEKQSKIAKGLRQQRAILGGVLILAVLAAGYAAYAQYRESQARRQADNAKLSERGNIAVAFSNQRGKEFDGLVLGLKAIDVRNGDEPPPEAVHGLREALKAVGSSVWLRKAPTPSVIEMTPDNERVLIMNQSKLGVFNAVTAEPILLKEVAPGSLWSDAKFSGNDKLLVVELAKIEDAEKDDVETTDQTRRSILHAWDLKSREATEKYQVELPHEYRSIININEQRIVTNSIERKASILDVSTGKIIAIINAEVYGPYTTISPRGTRAVTASSGVNLWDTSTGKLVAKLEKGEANVREFSDDDSHLLVGNSSYGTYTISLWNAVEGRKIAAFRMGDGNYVRTAGFIPGEMNIVFIVQDLRNLTDRKLKAQIYDMKSGQLLDSKLFESPTSSRINIDLNKMIVTIMNGLSESGRYYEDSYEERDRRTDENKITLWNFISGETRPLISNYPKPFRRFVTTDSLQRIVTVAEDYIVQIWETDAAPINTETLSLPQLRDLACNKLRYQAEFQEVVGICT